MTDQDLRTLLREHVTDHEPPFLVAPGKVIIRGRRARRARSAAAVSVAAVLGVGAVALHAVPGSGATATVADPGSAAGGNTISDHLLTSSARAFGQTHNDLPAGQVTAHDGDLQPVSPDSASAQYVRVAYALADSRTLSVDALGVDRGDLGEVGSSCTNGLADHEYVSCSMTRLPDGAWEMTSVGPIASLDAYGTHEVLTLDHPRTPDQDVFFLRSVRVIDGRNGVSGSASEVVHVSTPAAADAAWTVPVSTLRGLAEDPALADYGLPTQPAPRTIP